MKKKHFPQPLMAGLVQRQEKLTKSSLDVPFWNSGR